VWKGHLFIIIEGHVYTFQYKSCHSRYEEEEGRMKSNSLPNCLHKKRSEIADEANGKGDGRSFFKRISVVSPNQSTVFSTSQRFK
jgi:hypothetical protein